MLRWATLAQYLRDTMCKAKERCHFHYEFTLWRRQSGVNLISYEGQSWTWQMAWGIIIILWKFYDITSILNVYSLKSCDTSICSDHASLVHVKYFIHRVFSRELLILSWLNNANDTDMLPTSHVHRYSHPGEECLIKHIQMQQDIEPALFVAHTCSCL